ncbi:hypothetical protein [Asticcacaulis solisilvae]|uniref:hypothetical protein n=1 Tax=Asticcacaulis solisilvae TaxID=1217274 RepID=UPI003FD83463
MAALVAVAFSTSAHAERHRSTDNISSFETEDAIKGKVYIEAAMTTPMMDLLKKADVTNPTAMLEYGLALELGRPSVSSQLSQADRDKLKRGFREMLDLYLNSGDTFGQVTFKEDSMLDLPEFWILLAEHIGRPKQHIDASSVSQLTQGGGTDTASMVFIPDTSDQDQEFNLNNELVLPRKVVYAADACAESAMGFSRMAKIQKLDPSATKVTAEQFKQAREMAVRNYRAAYLEGTQACGDKPYFQKVADFAAQNLGHLGELKEDPNAQLADLNSAPTQ